MISRSVSFLSSQNLEVIRWVTSLLSPSKNMQFCHKQIRTQPLFSPPCASATYGSARMCRQKNRSYSEIIHLHIGITDRLGEHNTELCDCHSPPYMTVGSQWGYSGITHLHIGVTDRFGEHNSEPCNYHSPPFRSYNWVTHLHIGVTDRYGGHNSEQCDYHSPPYRSYRPLWWT